MILEARDFSHVRFTNKFKGDDSKMLDFKDIKMKKELSDLGKKLENEIKIRANNKFTIKEIDLDSIGGELRENAKYVFEIDKFKGNALALIFVNKDYKVKLGISSTILSLEDLKDLSIIVEEFQKIVDGFIVDKVMDTLYSIISEWAERYNNG